MPFSQDGRFSFIHIPKTGGSSIVQALHQAAPPVLYSGSGLWDILAARADAGAFVSVLRRSFGIAELGTFPQQHLPAALLRALVGEERWARAFTFAFVRNPWDLMVSSYFFFKEHVSTMIGSGHDADRAAMAQRCDTFERFVHFYPTMRSDSTQMLAGEDGECIVDFVGRYERLEEDFRCVCERIGLGKVPLPHLRATKHSSYRDYYTPSLRDAVADHFARDIDTYGYRF